MKNNENTYALIYIENKKPIKRSYKTAIEAFYDYEDRGCVKTELYNGRGQLLSYKVKNENDRYGVN